MSEETKSNPSIGNVTDDSIKLIINAVNKLSDSFEDTYQRLNYPGFVSVLGAILVFLPLFTRNLFSLSLDPEEQKIYVFAGALFVVLGAIWITVQNILTYKLQRAKQEAACRMLAIKVTAMGETQKAAMKSINEAPEANIQDFEFISK